MNVTIKNVDDKFLNILKELTSIFPKSSLEIENSKAYNDKAIKDILESKEEIEKNRKNGSLKLYNDFDLLLKDLRA
ncbi:hypothetical protein CBLAS_0826 [Campylobacter blaseri]|uniref:Uncharacterized protein n=1 Tax=Campylobacter blaseri TaxID=2042961 RepID=A0A2P8R2J2_9BACT|nr:hypothetical protein [Campylobacter blaseri]PSM52711.1 hypothetical protein CQ405_02985 [Campylobacter blaseri]PSM54359.1 hypothetical protein CRN67_02985 [Campylobacter blaseri]QKF86013.1 hypothetical protein CBLAS_0826 [Campylobacter blaseri]